MELKDELKMAYSRLTDIQDFELRDKMVAMALMHNAKGERYHALMWLTALQSEAGIPDMELVDDDDRYVFGGR